MSSGEGSLKPFASYVHLSAFTQPPLFRAAGLLIRHMWGLACASSLWCIKTVGDQCPFLACALSGQHPTGEDKNVSHRPRWCVRKTSPPLGTVEICRHDSRIRTLHKPRKRLPKRRGALLRRLHAEGTHRATEGNA